MSSCCGNRKPHRGRGADTEPLLPLYDDDTARQRQLHQKLHSYQMFKALSEGYMPSTEQLIANLRTLLASDLFNPGTEDLSHTGRQLARDVRTFLRLFIEILREKNNEDQVQEFFWHLAKSKASLDTSDLASQASRAKANANTRAAYNSLQTVGSLLLTNADFRLFLDDIATVGRRIFADTSYSVSDAVHHVAEVAQPSAEELEQIQGAGADEGKHPTKENLRDEVNIITTTAEEGIVRAGLTAKESTKEQISGEHKDALLHRLKQTVLKLRSRDDYSESVSTIAKIAQRYGSFYANAADDTIHALDEDITTNEDLKNAVDRFWALVRSFGDDEEWKKLEDRFHDVMKHSNKDPEFEHLMTNVGTSLEEVLTDPKFFDVADERFDELKTKFNRIGSESPLRADFDAFLQQLKRTLNKIPQDTAVAKLAAATKNIYLDLSHAYTDRTSTLVADVAHIFLPLLIRSVQRIPIPRLEISIPEMDLLIENLILEPGRTVNKSSFFPYKILVTSKTDMELAKVHSKKAQSKMKTIITVLLQGLNISASEFGYWIRAHSGLFFRFGDEGIGSFFLDERGIDVSVDLEIGKDRLAHLVTLRGVRVHVHKLDYKINRSRWKILLCLIKPFLKQLIRRSLEKKIAELVVSTVVTINRELVFARERLRAVNIANPQDYATLIRAVLARPQIYSNPSMHQRLAATPSKSGVFKGVYAPGSIVKVWRDEAVRAQDAIERGDEGSGLGLTWRNEIFNVNATTL